MVQYGMREVYAVSVYILIRTKSPSVPSAAKALCRIVTSTALAVRAINGFKIIKVIVYNANVSHIIWQWYNIWVLGRSQKEAKEATKVKLIKMKL